MMKIALSVQKHYKKASLCISHFNGFFKQTNKLKSSRAGLLHLHQPGIDVHTAICRQVQRELSLCCAVFSHFSRIITNNWAGILDLWHTGSPKRKKYKKRAKL